MCVDFNTSNSVHLTRCCPVSVTLMLLERIARKPKVFSTHTYNKK